MNKHKIGVLWVCKFFSVLEKYKNWYLLINCYSVSVIGHTDHFLWVLCIRSLNPGYSWTWLCLSHNIGVQFIIFYFTYTPYKHLQKKKFELESIWYLLKRQLLLSPSPQFDIYRPTKTGTEGPTSCGTQPFHADAITVKYN